MSHISKTMLPVWQNDIEIIYTELESFEYIVSKAVLWNVPERHTWRYISPHNTIDDEIDVSFILTGLSKWASVYNFVFDIHVAEVDIYGSSFFFLSGIYVCHKYVLVIQL